MFYIWETDPLFDTMVLDGTIGPLELLRMFDGRSHQKDWQPPSASILARRRHDGDFFEVYANVFGVGARAREALTPICDGAVEFLPVAGVDDRNLYLLNVLPVLDCLDEARTVFSRLGDLIVSVERYAFQPDRVEGHHVFRVAGFETDRIIASEALRAVVERSGLRGCRFRNAE